MDPVSLEPLAPREAIEFFRSKGLAPALRRFDYRDVWREEHARSFVVSKAMRDDVLRAIQEGFEEALTEGRTLDQFRAEMRPRLQKLGWWGRGIERDPQTGELQEVQLGSMHRLRVIFDTNMRTSYAAGHWARLQRTKDFLPYLEYRQIQRETKREEHAAFHGLILPIDHPLWRVIFPPNGWFCGCSVRPMNDRMLKREGKRLSTDAEIAALDVSSWTNPRTGETEDLLDGLDPAFATNPGHAWQQIDDRHSASLLGLDPRAADYDRGFLMELSALRLRDGRDTLLAYDQDRPADKPFSMIRDAGGLTNELLSLGENPDLRMGVLRGVASGAHVPLSDLDALSALPGLNQVAVLGIDGSVFRVARTGNTSDLASRDLVALQRLALARADDARGSLGLSSDQVSLVATHALLRALAARGDLAYSAAPAGAVADLFLRAAELLSDIQSLIRF